MSEAIVPSLLAASAPFCVGVESLMMSGNLEMICGRHFKFTKPVLMPQASRRVHQPTAQITQPPNQKIAILIIP